jgi:hypothetical protein
MAPHWLDSFAYIPDARFAAHCSLEQSLLYPYAHTGICQIGSHFTTGAQTFCQSSQ